MRAVEDLEKEFDLHGRLSRASVASLRDLIKGGPDPFSAITLACDAALFALAPDIASRLDDVDEMVRWNAVGVLLTRFRIPDHALKGLQFARSDPSTMVRGIALCGIGEVLPDVAGAFLRTEIARYLLDVFTDDQQELLLRGAAYDGILAAVDVLPLDRPPASRLLDLDGDVDPRKIEEFRRLFHEASAK